MFSAGIGDALGLVALGRAIKPAFAEAELPWLRELVAQLQKEGLVECGSRGVRMAPGGRKGPGYRYPASLWRNE